MKVTQVVVEIHEKRNNPNSYGHFDSRVAYTAELDNGDDRDAVISQLQTEAREFVLGECDRWVEGIKLEEERERARNNLDRAVRRAKTRPVDSDELAQFESDLSPLVAGEQSDYRAKLLAAQDEYLTNLQKELAEHISAAQKGLLSAGGKERFAQDVERLPEGERDGYRQRMAAALAPKAGADIEPLSQLRQNINDNDLTNKVPDDDWDDNLDDDDDDEEIPL